MVSEMIEKLTPEQEAKFPEYVERYIAKGLKTGETDRERFERGIHGCYDLAKLDRVPVIFVSSPIVGALAAPIAANVIHALKARSGSAVVSAVESAVDRSVYSAVVSAVVSAKGLFWHYWWGGQFGVSYVAYASFMRDELGVNIPSLAAYEDTCESGCYWWPNKDFCIACERPSEINMDDRGRLHSETGLAISWPDGWGIYRWHGVEVPKEAIENPASITVKQIKDCNNAETRRALIEIMGTGKYLIESGAQLIDTDFVEIEKGSGVRMPRMLLRSPEGDQYLEGTDGSTERCYWMNVPPTAITCREAHEAICGLKEDRCIAQG